MSTPQRAVPDVDNQPQYNDDEDYTDDDEDEFDDGEVERAPVIMDRSFLSP